MAVFPDRHKRKPIHQVANQENEKGSLKYFCKNLRLPHSVPFFHYKTHRIADRKQEGGKYEVSGCEAMPGCMFQGSVGELFASSRVDNDHKTDGHAPENIQGEKSRVAVWHVQSICVGYLLY